MAHKTYVGTQVSRAIGDDNMPSAAKTGILKALLHTDEGEMVDYIQEEMVSSIGMRADRMYDYAARGDYLFGLPSGQFVTGSGGSDVVQSVLQGIEGHPVLMDYCHYGSPNDLHLGWMNLMSAQGYDPATNKLGVLSAAKGVPVYLDDMVVVVPAGQATTIDPGSLEQWGVAAKAGWTPARQTLTPATRLLVLPSPIESDPAAVDEHLKVTAIWAGGTTGLTMQRQVFMIPITGVDANANYFHARYVVGNQVKYWIYKSGSGTYPTLDAVFNAPQSTGGTFFPFVYFRFDKVSEISNKTSASYQAGFNMTRRLGMDYDQIAEAIDANPDIDQIEQAMLMFAVPANTEDQLQRQYLFTFFNNLYLSPQFDGQRQHTPTDGALAGLASRLTRTAAPSIVIQDKRFKLSLDFAGLYKRRVAGQLGPVGTYDSGFVETSSTMTVTDTTTGQPITVTTPSKYHYFRQQVSTGFYDEIEVEDLRTVFWILGDFKQAVGEGDAEILLVPIDHSITQAYSIPVREELYARSAQYIFNSVVVQHLKWYETGFFQAVVFVVAIVITVWSLGTQAWTIGAAVAAGSYALASILVLSAILQYVILYYTFKLFVKVFGARFALFVAVIAAVAGMSGELTSGVEGAPWADQLLTASSGISKAVNDKTLSDINKLVGEQKTLLEQEAEQTKVLETAQDLLDQPVHLSPFVIFGESPRDYYNRTVHSGNIGVFGIEAISNYVENALTLPKLSTTVEGPTYAD